jgi:hypothetical protein
VTVCVFISVLSTQVRMLEVICIVDNNFKLIML